MQEHTLVELPVKFSVIWICVMLTYLLGDVLRIFSGDYKLEKWVRWSSHRACGWELPP